MDLRKNILSAILLAIGFVLHQVTPSFGFVTFDIQLAMLFVIIAINMDFKNTLLVSLASGTITALTTKFPGGQIPNIVDKAVTGLVVYLLITAITKIANKYAAVTIAGLIGTLLSGTIFLGSALLLVKQLPMPFTALFLAVVLPTAIANTFLTPALFYLVSVSKKAAKVEI